MAATDVFDQLLEVSLLLQADLDRSLTAAGLTVTKTHLLWEVHHRGPCPQQRLAEALGVSPRHITGLVDALGAQGLVHRLPHPGDRRAVLVALTPEGTATISRMQAERERDAAALIGDLDPGAVEALRLGLDAVLVRLRQLVGDPQGDAAGDPQGDAAGDAGPDAGLDAGADAGADR